jgi:uncharacterized protein DUF4268
MSDLGRLKRVDLRKIWPTEAQHFTRWLASEDNLALLGDTLGIDLEPEAVEQNVGPFRADILCKDTLSDRWVLIENQLERTDHTHLGQLITYAAGLDAVTIVWIAARIRDEHRAACDWLNDITASDVRFFALEVELWRIGDSPAAPKFNVVSKPNDWSREAEKGAQARSVAGLTPLKEQYLAYWTDFRELAEHSEAGMRFSPPTASQYIVIGLGHNSHVYCAISSQNRSTRVGINFSDERGAEFYHFCKQRRDEIEAALGFALEWDDKPDRQRSIAEISKRDQDPTDESDWPRQHKWLVDHASRLHTVFKPYIARLRRKTAGGETK